MYSNKWFKSTILRECYATFIMCHIYILSGSAISFVAILIPQIQREKYVSPETESWFGASTPLGSIVGLPIIYLVAIMGRRSNFQINIIVSCTGWIVVAVSPSMLVTTVGLVIVGVSYVSAVAIVSTYVSETSEVKHRGILLSVDFLCIGIGSSIMFIMNVIMSWRFVALIMALLCIHGFLQSLFLPETKYWHLLKGNEEKARKSILWFQPHLSEEDVNSQIRSIQESIERDSEVTNNASLVKFVKSLRKFRYLKPVILGSLLFATRAGSGRPLMMSYTVNIFRDLKTPYNPEILAAGLGISETIGSFCVLILVHFMKRKILLHLLSLVMVVGLGVTIVYQIHREVTGTNSIPWLPVAGTYVYGTIVAGGFLSSIGLIASEIQYPYFRGPAMTLFVFILVITVLVYNVTFPYFEVMLPIHYLFIFFLCCIICGNMIVWLFVPETRDKTFYEN